MFKLNNSSASKIAVGILSAVITLSLSYSLASASTTNDQSIRLRQEPNTSSAILKTLDKRIGNYTIRDYFFPPEQDEESTGQIAALYMQKAHKGLPRKVLDSLTERKRDD